MITYSITDKGLVFTADSDSQEELRTYADDYPRQFSCVLDDVIGNGLECVPGEHHGGLTDSEVFSDDYARADNGDCEHLGRVFWFPNYQVENPWDTLAETGEVIFPLGDN